MTKQNKFKLLFFLILAIGAIFLIAAGLPNLELSPGRPFSLEGSTPPEIEDYLRLGGGELVFLCIRGVFALALIMFPLYILIHILTPEGRQRLIRDLILLGSLFIFLIIFDWINRNLVSQSPASPLDDFQPFIQPNASGPIVEFVGEPPDWLLLFASFGLAVLLTAAFVVAVWFLRQHRQPEPIRPMEKLARRAGQAAEAIRAGSNFKDTVIRCYAEMVQILHEERGIQRETSMTPLEFEQFLIEKGLPREPVRDLTRLFEQVRYGNRRTGIHEEQQAIASLNEIAAFGKNSG